MKPAAAVDPEEFQRLLRRNSRLPLVGGVIGAAVFVALIAYLLSVIGWVEHSDRISRSAAEVQRRMIDMETGMRGYVIAGDESFLEPYERALPLVGADLDKLRALVSDNTRQVERVDRIRALSQAWQGFAREVIDKRRGGNTDTGNLVRLGQGKRMTDDIRDEFTAFGNTEQALRATRRAESNNTAAVVVALFILLTVGSAALLALFGRRQLMALSQNYEAALKEQAVQATQLQHQAWLRGAQNDLSAELVGELSAQEIGRKALAFFSKHLGSQVGALYVRERDGSLRRSASYGFSEEAEASQQVLRTGTTLLAQASAQRRTLTVDPVDADYLRVNTGLGEMAPRTVLLLPAAHNGMVNGVVELGLAAPPDERQESLLQLVADSIGSSLSAARYREQLQGALVETQQLNEELQVQQE